MSALGPQLKVITGRVDDAGVVTVDGMDASYAGSTSFATVPVTNIGFKPNYAALTVWADGATPTAWAVSAVGFASAGRRVTLTGGTVAEKRGTEITVISHDNGDDTINATVVTSVAATVNTAWAIRCTTMTPGTSDGVFFELILTGS